MLIFLNKAHWEKKKAFRIFEIHSMAAEWFEFFTSGKQVKTGNFQ